MLTADGVVSLIGCLMGNPFINAVYIGHPGWKAMGGRIGYSAATGLMVIVLSWFGIISVMLALIPLVAISPILLYIGMLIGAQAFQTTPTHHAPAIVLALTPHLAAWCKTLIDGALGAAGDQRLPRSASISSAGAACSITASKCWAAARSCPGWCSARSACSSIDRKFVEGRRPSRWPGAVLTFFGFMHGEAVGIGSRAWRHAVGGARLCDRRRVPVRAEPAARDGRSHDGAGASQTDRACRPGGVITLLPQTRQQ